MFVFSFQDSIFNEVIFRNHLLLAFTIVILLFMDVIKFSRWFVGICFGSYLIDIVDECMY